MNAGFDQMTYRVDAYHPAIPSKIPGQTYRRVNHLVQISNHLERQASIREEPLWPVTARRRRSRRQGAFSQMNGLRVSRLELDELHAYVGRRRRQHEKPISGDPRGDQYTFVALASSTRAIIAYRTGKRDSATTDDFIQDLRSRVIGTPEISTDGFRPYKPAIRDAFGSRVAHGTITKTYSVTHLTVKEASRRYSPAAVIAVERDVVSGVPAEISTSYVERSHLTLRMSSKRFARLSLGFSKRLENHCAAVSLHVAFYNLCRTHEALRTTPAVALGIADRVWSIGDLLDAALAALPIEPTTTAPQRRRRFRVIEGGQS
jgi:IS1 family transposase